MNRSTTSSAPLRQVDIARLDRWMSRHGIGGDAPCMTEPALGGTQNVVLFVRKGDFDGVLRAAPAGSASKAASIRREMRLLPSLSGSAVPHGRLVAACEDQSVIGGPFYLMQRTDGWPLPLSYWPDRIAGNPDRLRELYFSAVDAAAAMASFDWKDAGLEDFGRPDGFHERQADRWSRYFESFRGRELEGFTDAARWLAAHAPRSWSPGLMHGDFHLHNMLFTHDDGPIEVAAILDWEMATIGDPLLDLAYLLIAWPPEGDDMRAGRNLPLEGVPSREDMLERYERCCGLSTALIDHYIVLARWKMAIILEGSYQRFSADPTEAERAELFGILASDYMRKAGSLARHLAKAATR